MEYINYKRATPVKGANFNYRREDYYIKKVEDGIVYTTNGKMFSQKALQTSGVMFNQFKAKSNSPRGVRGQRRENMEDELTELKYELKGYKSDLRNLFQEMDYEAGQKGKDWSDADANRYGGEMNEVEEKIEKLENQIRMREEKLSYNNGGFMDSVYKRGGMLTPSQRYILEIKGLSGLSQKAIEDYISENKLSNDEVLNIVIGLGRKQIDGKNVATAMIGKKDNVESKKLLAFAKSKKALYYADGGFMDSVYKRGGALKGNQKRIDINYNGKIDSEDFKLLRRKMNQGGEFPGYGETVQGEDINYEMKSYFSRTHKELLITTKDKKVSKGGVNIFYNDLIFVTKDRWDIPVKDILKVEILKENMAIGGGIGNYEEYQGTMVYEAIPYIVKELPYHYQIFEDPIGGTRVIAQKEALLKLQKHLKQVYGVDSRIRKEGFGLPELTLKNETIDKFNTGGEHVTFARKSKAIAKQFEGKQVEPKYQRTYGKRYDKKEAKEVGNKIAGKMKNTYDQKAFGGLFGKSKIVSNNKVSDLDDKQVTLKNGEIVQVLDQSGDTLMVMNLNKLGTGAVPKRINISEVDMTSFMAGGKVEKKTTKTTKNQTPDKRGGAMQLAKKTRKEGESWHDALRRATAEIKKTKSNN